MIPDLTPAEIARFYSKVRLGGCGLTWAGGDTHEFGYGQFAIYRDGKRVRILAHRLMYKLATGTDPDGEVVRHGCDTPPCLTPDCFSLGTQADNIQDAVERGHMNATGLHAYRTERDANAARRVTENWKRCSHCKAIKQLGEFHRNRGNFDGRQYWCKACIAERRRLTAVAA